MRYEREYERLDKIMVAIEETLQDELPVAAMGEMVNAIAALRRAQGHMDT